METMRQAAIRGAAWLDQVTPGWWGSVNVETLSSEANCVIMQVYGRGSWSWIWYFLSGNHAVGEEAVTAAEFMDSHGFGTACQLEDAWRRAWTEEIDRRLFAALQEQREDPGIIRVICTA